MKNGYTIIDSHCHIYPEKIAARAVAGTDHFYDIVSKCLGTTADLAVRGAGAGIDHFIVQSVATTPHQVRSINNFIADEVAKSGGRFTGLGTLHPESEDIAGDVEHLLSLGLRGVKLHPDIQRFKLDDYRCLKIYELCEGRLPILAHTGDYRYDFSNPNRLMPILRIYQNLTVIGAHMGGWSIQDEASRKLCDFPNLYVDCSSSFYNLEPALAREIMLRYGPDRVLFATDYPMWEPTEELEYFFSLGFSEEENRKMLSENAIRLFGLEL
ncbi:MAG: amidohydrolase [Ruminococcaceae bacterium]|nr:amidohydrolase [Oscillospiraceae bacterium]